jgi:hypothetical protein
MFVPGWPANPEDVLGLGPLLTQRGINMMEFYPRGMHQKLVDDITDWILKKLRCISPDLKDNQGNVRKGNNYANRSSLPTILFTGSD